ncbi:MAG: hypothetical protein WBC05_15700, partial [Sedimentisphaerales bacterium]
MNKKQHNLILSSLIVMVVVCLLHGSICFAEFRAAIAVCNVTPDPLLPVSGGAGPSRAASKKFGELTVRALVFENDGTRVAICSTDFLGFPGVLCSKVRRQVPGINPKNILIAATHN